MDVLLTFQAEFGHLRLLPFRIHHSSTPYTTKKKSFELTHALQDQCKSGTPLVEFAGEGG
ncbi:uncharacterized protein EURHEDRAFT_408735, partial [Aspergillus ruber CBS 135680]